jgi:hypothetical protein
MSLYFNVLECCVGTGALKAVTEKNTICILPPKSKSACFLLLAFTGLLFIPEQGVSMFLRKFSKLLPDYMK